MKRLLTSVALGGLAFASAPAFAQSAYPEGFSPYGTISVSSVGSTGGGSSTTLGYGNFGFGWDFGGNFGVDYSMYGFSLSSGGSSDTVSANYLALAYKMGDLRFSVGAPRAAYDRYGHFRLEKTVPIYGVFLLEGFASTVTIVDLQTGSDYRSYGVRLDGATAGGLNYAVSLHGVDGLSDARALSASGQYTLGSDVVLTGGLDYFTFDGTDYTKAKLGVAKDFGRFDAALNLAHINSSMSGNATIYEVSGSFDVTDKFNVGLGYFGFSNSSGSDLISVDASYRFYAGATAFASLARPADSSSTDPIYAIGLRYDF